MEGDIHASPQGARAIYRWYGRARVDYIEYYIRVYIAYNAWFREVTGQTNDRQALAHLKKRYVIWDDYAKGRALHRLTAYMEQLVELTQREPLFARTLYWSGSIESTADWRSLIEFWYQVRCRLVHGSTVPPLYVRLAYDTLSLFMGEIVNRMQNCFTAEDYTVMGELHSLAVTSAPTTERFQHLQNRLYQKYIASPNIWQVDMQRVLDDGT